MSTVGSRIYDSRRNAGLSQAQLAEKAGVTLSIISRYELDKTKPRRRTLSSLANVLHVDEDWLEFGECEDFDDKVINKQFAKYLGDAQRNLRLTDPEKADLLTTLLSDEETQSDFVNLLIQVTLEYIEDPEFLRKFVDVSERKLKERKGTYTPSEDDPFRVRILELENRVKALESQSSHPAQPLNLDDQE